MIALKWLSPTLRSCHGGSHDWAAQPHLAIDPAKLEPCVVGIHVADPDDPQQLLPWLAPRAAWVEVPASARVIRAGNKTVVSEAFLYAVSPWSWRHALLWSAGWLDWLDARYRAENPEDEDPSPQRATALIRRYAWAPAIPDDDAKKIALNTRITRFGPEAAWYTWYTQDCIGGGKSAFSKALATWRKRAMKGGWYQPAAASLRYAHQSLRAYLGGWLPPSAVARGPFPAVDT